MLALLAGRGSHPGSAAARLITPGDVKRAKVSVAQLSEIKSRNGARRTTTAEQARTRDVLHAAVEQFSDRFGAAVDLAFEDADGTRVALLSLIPRRKERRTAAAKPPATSTPEDVGSTPTGRGSFLRGSSLPCYAEPMDPVIEAYKKGIDRTLLRENLKLTVEQRLRNLMELQKLADELHRAGAGKRR